MLEDMAPNSTELKCDLTKLVRHNIPEIKKFDYLCFHPESNCHFVRIIEGFKEDFCGYKKAY